MDSTFKFNTVFWQTRLTILLKNCGLCPSIAIFAQAAAETAELIAAFFTNGHVEGSALWFNLSAKSEADEVGRSGAELYLELQKTSRIIFAPFPCNVIFFRIHLLKIAYP